jgi:hypothetical protein
VGSAVCSLQSEGTVTVVVYYTKFVNLGGESRFAVTLQAKAELSDDMHCARIRREYEDPLFSCDVGI